MNSSGFKSGTPGISIGLVRDRVRTTSAKPVGLRVLRPVENHPFHLVGAQRLGALLPDDPADGVRDVALAAAVRPDDRGNPLR